MLPSVKEFAEVINPERVLHVHASLHFEELEEKGLLESFIRNYHLLRKNGFNIYAEAVGWNGFLNSTEKYKSLMNSAGIEFFYAPFIGNKKTLDYPELYEENELKQLGIAEEKMNWFRQKGEICNAGYNTGVVFSNGDIYPCFQIKDKIGNIYEEINFKSDLSTCPAKKCACPLNKYDEYLFSKAKTVN